MSTNELHQRMIGGAASAILQRLSKLDPQARAAILSGEDNAALSDLLAGALLPAVLMAAPNDGMQKVQVPGGMAVGAVVWSGNAAAALTFEAGVPAPDFMHAMGALTASIIKHGVGAGVMSIPGDTAAPAGEGAAHGVH